uniref:Squalene monooxygenase n=3 Tax=Phaeomonas parva TaxID=124430 RepID=A0A7S1XVK9_9STRA|mmetsp:Transcript_41255/g.129238  ORF Transcript_41255/g.129238 Transcript_41255/m.129238 type:complete len:315 (+) Transcript_41255:897-1841(+)
MWTGDVAGGDALGSPRKQYFWEAFPAGSGEAHRTTYLFTYMDADEERPSLIDMLEDYWDLLPEYQREAHSAFRDGLSVEEAVAEGRFKINRCLYGCFPTFKDSPLRPPAKGILAIGDASGIQSPLSFGGFGALTRHINRLTSGIIEALEAGALSEKDLGSLNPYLPNLSATWMFQRSMMTPIGSRRPSDFVNRLLRTNFGIMDDLGREILRPFNQDVVRPIGLLQVLAQAMVRDPLNTPGLLYHLGPLTVLDWMGHFGAMFAYLALYKGLAGPLRSYADSLWASEKAEDKKTAFKIRRLVEAWEYGSGEDYTGF